MNKNQVDSLCCGVHSIQTQMKLQNHEAEIRFFRILQILDYMF